MVAAALAENTTITTIKCVQSLRTLLPFIESASLLSSLGYEAVTLSKQLTHQMTPNPRRALLSHAASQPPILVLTLGWHHGKF